jgi:Arc/MetJ-type ribon-helix-helix transcriptional regulator
MDAPLPPKIEQLIGERLQSGSYKSAIEVIEDAFEALTERENFEAVRAELDHADEQLERGEYTDSSTSSTGRETPSERSSLESSRFRIRLPQIMALHFRRLLLTQYSEKCRRDILQRASRPQLPALVVH